MLGNAWAIQQSACNCVQWNLYKGTTELCGFSRQVVCQDGDNEHEFLMIVWGDISKAFKNS